MFSEIFAGKSEIIVHPDGLSAEEFQFADGSTVTVRVGPDALSGRARQLTVEAAVFLLEQAKFRILSMMKD